MAKLAHDMAEADPVGDLADLFHDVWIKSGFQGTILVSRALTLGVVSDAKRRFDTDHARVAVLVNWEDMTFRFESRER